MSNGFKLDEEAAYDKLTKATIVDDNNGSATLYAVVCWNDDVSSHGGFVVTSAQEAVEGAKQVNEQSDPDHPCRYIPIAVGMSYEAFKVIFGNPDGPDA